MRTLAEYTKWMRVELQRKKDEAEKQVNMRVDARRDLLGAANAGGEVYAYAYAISLLDSITYGSKKPDPGKVQKT